VATTEPSSIVIAGAGHAGGSAAAFLRQFGWTGQITLIGEEPLPPYQRPPLSKAWLKGEASADSLALRPPKYYSGNGIDLRLGQRVTSIDRAARNVILDTNEILKYSHLILALGSRLRKLPVPGADLPGVMELRTAADADRIKAALKPGMRLAVVGGGYIGLEVAASARALGAAVTVVEREERLLARVASPGLSHFFQATHAAKGVEILLGANVAVLEGDSGGGVAAVRLADGRRIACDAAIVGVGALANDAIAAAAGLECSDGVMVDLATRTSDARIFAIGDCTRRPLPHYQKIARLESVPNALEQARQAASVICGRPAPAPEVPWFWSDQYDVKLQMAGMPFDVAATVTRGDPAAAKFAIFLLDQAGAVQAVEAINAAPEFMAGRQLIANRKIIAPEQLTNPAISMKELLAST
jgi:3-phenylpropionate/trans-cinnamate dioxygenase ferredoxin reductase component